MPDKVKPALAGDKGTQLKTLRIAYLSGPCDAPAVFKSWLQNRDPDYFGTNYMKQFIEMCTELNAESYVITTLPGNYSLVNKGRFIFENRPLLSDGLRGIFYHLSFVPWFARLTPKIIQYKPDVLVVTMNQSYWFLWFFLRWFGIPMVPSFHSVLWPKHGTRKLSSRILWQLNRILVLKYMKVIVVTSNDITRQLQQLLGEAVAAQIEFVRHFPTYTSSQFASVLPPNLATCPPFRVFFAGRIEIEKGIYELVEIARKVEAKRRGYFHFDICGDGKELNSLRKKIIEEKLERVITCHGYCAPKLMSPLLEAAHAWIVPTTAGCEAGFEMVCAEAILANRPLITSDVCPALEDVRGAAIEVSPDNVDEYSEAILKLSAETKCYALKQQACVALQAQFYELKNSWATKMKYVLTKYFTQTNGPSSNKATS